MVQMLSHYMRVVLIMVQQMWTNPQPCRNKFPLQELDAITPGPDPLPGPDTPPLHAPPARPATAVLIANSQVLDG